MSINLFDRQALPGFATIAVLLWLPLAAGGALAQAASDYPDPNERLDWTIAFGPGGGNDIMARTLIDILDKHDLYPGDIIAENREGGSGAVGWGYLHGQAGNPYAISTTSGSYITTPLQADTPWGPTAFTPIALLATDDLLLLVNGESDIGSLEEFIERAKTDPVTIGGIGAVNVDFIVPTLLAEKAGFEFEYVSFNAAGELNTALLSNALDAIVSNPGEVLGLIESGDMKALAYSGQKTPASLGDIPTLGEAGYPVNISMPRGLILPPDVPAQAQEWWIETMKKVVETPEWQEYIESNNLTENIRYGEDFRAFLEETSGTFEDILREQGAID
jgi:putative tricarboxylic transport membrane protein